MPCPSSLRFPAAASVASLNSCERPRPSFVGSKLSASASLGEGMLLVGVVSPHVASPRVPAASFSPRPSPVALSGAVLLEPHFCCVQQAWRSGSASSGCVHRAGPSCRCVPNCEARASRCFPLLLCLAAFASSCSAHLLPHQSRAMRLKRSHINIGRQRVNVFWLAVVLFVLFCYPCSVVFACVCVLMCLLYLPSLSTDPRLFRVMEGDGGKIKRRTASVHPSIHRPSNHP